MQLWQESFTLTNKEELGIVYKGSLGSIYVSGIKGGKEKNG